MELKITKYQQPAAVEFNYEELTAELKAKLSEYEGLVYTEETIKEAKADRAKLNSLAKALNDERIRLEREYMQPFGDFKAKINELIQLIKAPCGIIDQQVKEYEEACKAKKKEDIEKLFEAECFPEWLDVTLIFDVKWLNASVSLKKVEDDLTTWRKKITEDLETLKTLPEYSFEATESYKKNLDLGSALRTAAQLSDLAKRKAEAEAKKAAEEAKREEETNRRMAENAQNGENQDFNTKVEEVSTENEKAEKRDWVAFKAYLTIYEANMLKSFFERNNIKFERG
jgi:hypothetical protein